MSDYIDKCHYFNSCCFIGRLFEDASTRTFGNGNTVLNFTLSIKEQGTKYDTGEAFTRFLLIRVSYYKNIQHLTALKKDAIVEVLGKWNRRQYIEKATGQKKYINEVIASFVDHKKGYEEERALPARQAEAAVAGNGKAQPVGIGAENEDEDMPF